MFEIDNDYIREVNAAYWEEESEMKDGTHPSQILERVRSELDKTGVTGEITFMDYLDNGEVGVEVGGKVYGIFDYNNNVFKNVAVEPNLLSKDKQDVFWKVAFSYYRIGGEIVHLIPVSIAEQLKQ